MARKAALTTGAVAAHCQVSIETIINWIKAGKLDAFSTPGGHRRIYVEDFQEFLHTHGMPPFGEEAAARRRILVVDDEPDIVRMVADTLARTGQYEIATAADGFEAGIQLAKFRPDLVVLDLMMPHINGFKVCQLIKSNRDTREVLVLVITGYAQEENIRRALECGADQCMTKPFSPFALLQNIEGLFQRKDQSTVAIPQISGS